MTQGPIARSFIEGNEFHIVWWDPKHEIWPEENRFGKPATIAHEAHLAGVSMLRRAPGVSCDSRTKPVINRKITLE